MEISLAIKENDMEVPQKTKNWILTWTSYLSSVREILGNEQQREKIAATLSAAKNIEYSTHDSPMFPLMDG